MYLMIIEEVESKITQLLKTANPVFNQIIVTNEQVKLLLKHLENCEFKSIDSEDYWKMYQIFYSNEGISYIELLFLRGHDLGITPDYYFKEEALAFSKVIDKEVFHIWSQHADEGYEVYKDGNCINSVVSDTHGPIVTVNGKSVEIPKKSTWYGTKYYEGQVIDENSMVLKRIRDYSGYNKFPSEFILLGDKEIANFESLMKKIGSV